MPRNTNSYDRKLKPRVTRRLCVISTEDSVRGAFAYFKYLAKVYEDRFIIKVSDIIPSVDGKSSPEHVLNRLKPYGYDKFYDTCWVVSDVDNWGEAKLNEVAGNCAKMDSVYTAISNNCFEIWLLYHKSGFSQQFLRSSECKQAGEMFLERSGGLEGLISEGSTRIAIEKAKSMPSADDIWPQTQGSHIFKLLDYLLSGRV